MKLTETAHKLMKKWNINSWWDFWAIMLVFSLAGMCVVAVRKPFFHVIGITQETPFVVKFFCWLLIVFPSYQAGLLIFGFLLGQFPFFWEKEKQMLRGIRKLFGARKSSSSNPSDDQNIYSIK